MTIEEMLPLAARLADEKARELEALDAAYAGVALQLPAPAPYGLDDVGWDRYCDAREEMR